MVHRLIYFTSKIIRLDQIGDLSDIFANKVHSLIHDTLKAVSFLPKMSFELGDCAIPSAKFIIARVI